MATKSQIVKPVAAIVGVAFVSSLAITSTAVAAENPFDASDLDAGYMLADSHGDDKGEEGECGEGKCGEGKCGDDKGEDGSCGEDKGEDGKCGEGKCGGSA